MRTDTILPPSALFRAVLFFLLALFLQGCSGDDLSGSGTHAAPEPASLVLTAELPRLSASVEGTRAQRAIPDHIEQNEIHCLTFFLVDWDKNKLVGYRNIYPNPEDPDFKDDRDAGNGFLNANGEIDPTLTEGKTVRLTFPYANPLHGEAERLSRGNYTLLAVANYREANKAGIEIAKEIDAVIKMFDKDKGIENFKENCKSMYNLVLKMPREDEQGNPTSEPSARQPYLRPAEVAIPVSYACDMSLISGTNRADIKLQRVCARVQIAVKNYSEYPLTVHDLQLSNNFTQSGCFLIPRQDTDRNYNEWQQEDEWDNWGAPDVRNKRAITPFVSDTKIQKMATTIIFDGLIYESRNLETPYTYTLDVEYENQTGYVYFDLANSTNITTATNVKAGYYLIKRQGTNDFIFATETNPKVTTSGNLNEKKLVAESQNDYFWQLVQDGTNYKLWNVGKGEYIQFPSNNNNPLTMVTQQNQASNITFENSGRNGIALKSNNRYANIGTNGTLNATNRNPVPFVLIPLEKHDEARLKHTITLTTIDPVTAEVFPVHEIRRNDYIRVLVEVKYNPDEGDFEFIVSRWDQGGGNIDYN